MCWDFSDRGLEITASTSHRNEAFRPIWFWSFADFCDSKVFRDTSRVLGLCMENKTTCEASVVSSPGRSVSDGSVAHYKYFHWRAGEWCPNSILSVLKQTIITPMITTVVTNFCCCHLQFWEESQVLRRGIEALPVDVSSCLSPSAWKLTCSAKMWQHRSQNTLWPMPLQSLR